MDITYYLDQDGFKVQIGTIVAYEENFLTPDNADKLYVIVRMPNYGNTVIMREIDNEGDYDNPTIVDETDIEVEPWKIGAI